jgi:hypothetical protein
MKLDLIRKEFTSHSTIGDLLIDSVFFCFTLEDVVRDIKILKETAIPYGTYQVITNYSNRFHRVMPLILNIPNFEGVRIHPGNSNVDTEGCILVGLKKTENYILQSVFAFNKLFPLLQEGIQDGVVLLTISKG